MAQIALDLEKDPPRKEATDNGNKVRLFNREFYPVIVVLLNLLSGLPYKSVYIFRPCSH